MLLHNGRLTDASVSQIGSTCPELLELSIYQCSLLTDSSVSAVAEGCTKLLKLNCRSVPHMTDSSLSMIGLNCLQLQGICVENTQVTDEGVTELLGRIDGLSFMPSNCCIIPDLWPGNSRAYYDGATEGAEALFA